MLWGWWWSHGGREFQTRTLIRKAPFIPFLSFLYSLVLFPCLLHPLYLAGFPLSLSTAGNYHPMNISEQNDWLGDCRTERQLVIWLEREREERRNVGCEGKKGLFLSCQLVLGSCFGKDSRSLSVFPHCTFSLSLLVLQRSSRKNKYKHIPGNAKIISRTFPKISSNASRQ